MQLIVKYQNPPKPQQDTSFPFVSQQTTYHDGQQHDAHDRLNQPLRDIYNI